MSNMNSTQHEREPAPSYRQSFDTLAHIPADPNLSEFRASRIDNFWIKVFPPTPKCYICQDKTDTANLLSRPGCDHKICGKCLIKVFERAVNDKKCMPPSFCPHGEVSPDMAPGLFDDVFLAQWNEKYFEYLEQTVPS
ncbi:hypothetical protein B0H65DRAFT_155237 [Neurospora tetraspora]|uniref:Zinc finger C3HC4 RING-type domain-containing protein n=1 Tax=Neurospora tetraspora TaxID=94610 RepID=A0AAE0JH47_9PEZI|nr:hypothetical protein B0H65DRAFT_155237 [Neurospora tetraspora]